MKRLLPSAGDARWPMKAVGDAGQAYRWRLASRLLADDLRAAPDDGALLALRGYASLYEKRYSEAEQILSVAVSRGFGWVEVCYGLAYAKFMLGKFADALELLQSPLMTDEFAASGLLQARCLYQLERRAEAVVLLRSYLVLAPEDAEAHGLLGLLSYELGEAELARRHFALRGSYLAMSQRAVSFSDRIFPGSSIFLRSAL